jgi:NAD(P)-dependent dehydrogenase (short-subunit alcohol dehydrogenase family)
MKIIGDVALVTGASRGIGAAIAKTFAQNGIKVAVNFAHATARADTVVKEILDQGGEAIAIQADVGNHTAVNNMVTRIERELGSVDILVNNAGITGQAEMGEFPPDLWNQILNVNLTGAMYCINRVMPAMRKQHQGRIINIASTCGIKGCERSAAYSASKSGMHGLTRSIARDVAPLGITVNAIAPGPIATEMLLALPKDLLDGYQSAVPMQRFGEPVEIAETALFLASKGAAFITGQVIRVCGGESL